MFKSCYLKSEAKPRVYIRFLFRDNPKAGVTNYIIHTKSLVFTGYKNQDKKNRGAAEAFYRGFMSRNDEGEVCIIFKSCYLKTEDLADVSGVSHGRRIHLGPRRSLFVYSLKKECLLQVSIALNGVYCRSFPKIKTSLRNMPLTGGFYKA